MKANHNYSERIILLEEAVTNIVKRTFESKSQQDLLNKSTPGAVTNIVKRTFESKSQQGYVLSIFKKAVTNIVKRTFESKSQRISTLLIP
ncbi:MAG TPA: hypothetical protein PL089_14045 [Ignavibacteria bacterium]|nr:hypothetical protein [Ignavibacteria bacterium]